MKNRISSGRTQHLNFTLSAVQFYTKLCDSPVMLVGMSEVISNDAMSRLACFAISMRRWRFSLLASSRFCAICLNCLETCVMVVMNLWKNIESKLKLFLDWSTVAHFIGWHVCFLHQGCAELVQNIKKCIILKVFLDQSAVAHFVGWHVCFFCVVKWWEIKACSFVANEKL